MSCAVQRMCQRLKTSSEFANESMWLSRDEMEQLLYMPGDDLGSKAEAAAIALEVLWKELWVAGLPVHVADAPTTLARAIERVKLAL